MKDIEKLRAGTFKYQVFAQGFLSLVHDEDEVALRDAQEAGIASLEERNLVIALPTVTSYSRQIRELNFATMKRIGRKYFMTLTDNEGLIADLEEYLSEELEQKKVNRIDDLRFPRVVTKENPLPFAEYRRYTAAVLAGQAKMIFKLVNNDR